MLFVGKPVYAMHEKLSIPAFELESDILDYLETWSKEDILPSKALIAEYDLLSQQCAQKKWLRCVYTSNLFKVETLITLERLAEAHKSLLYTQALLPDNASLVEKARLKISALDILTHKGSSEEIEQLIDELNSLAAATLAKEGNEGVGKIYVAIGRSQTITYQYAEAIKNLQKAYVEFDRVNDLKSTGNALVSLGNVYSAIDNTDKALEYFELALATDQQLGNEFNESVVLFNIGHAYLNKQDYEQSKRYFIQALTLSEKLEDTIGIMWTKLMLGHVALESNNIREALALFQETKSTFVEAQESTLLYSALFGSAKAYVALGNVDAADAIMQETTALFDSIAVPPKQVERLLLESKILHLQGDYDRAYETLEQAMDLQLEIKKQEKASLVERYQVEFDTKLKEQQNRALLEQNNEQLIQLAKQERERLIWMFVIVAVAVCVVVLVVFLVHQNRLRREFKRMAMRDPLTGQPNRRSILAFAKSMYKRAQDQQSSIGIAIIDLDFFKKINDEYGHETGDNVLKAFGVACKNAIRTQDSFGRYGGEEWLLVLSNVTEKQFEAIFERLSKEINDANIDGFPEDRKITFSMGAVSIQPSKETSLQAIIQTADELLYAAKEQGRNRVISEVSA